MQNQAVAKGSGDHGVPNQMKKCYMVEQKKKSHNWYT